MNRHKIVLYNPRAVFWTMPLGLLAVGSALDPARYDVQIIDARLERDPLAALRAALPDALCLGITVLTGAPIRDAQAASRAAKALRPDLPVVWGGWQPSLFPRECLDEQSVDVAVSGQGEDTFAELIDRYAAGLPAGALQGQRPRQHDRHFRAVGDRDGVRVGVEGVPQPQQEFVAEEVPARLVGEPGQFRRRNRNRRPRRHTREKERCRYNSRQSLQCMSHCLIILQNVIQRALYVE